MPLGERFSGEPAPNDDDIEGATSWTTGEDERHTARTSDGWNIGLYRYRPRGDRVGISAVMGHGLCGSRLIFDVHPDYSMARSLATGRFDVWLVDDLVFRDIPAAVDAVLEVTGADRVHWVGTEMSGITLGSPALTPPEAEVPGVNAQFLESSFRPSNTDWVVTARYFRHGVPDEATAIVDQFTDWITHATTRSVDHSVVWSDRPGEFHLPVLLFAGA